MTNTKMKLRTYALKKSKTKTTDSKAIYNNWFIYKKFPNIKILPFFFFATRGMQNGKLM